MSTLPIEIMVLNAGKRMRELAESNDWAACRRQALRESFGKLAAGDCDEVAVLKAIILDAGSRRSDVKVLDDLTAQHVSCFWRGYYGAWMPRSIEQSAEWSARLTP